MKKKTKQIKNCVPVDSSSFKEINEKQELK